MEGGTLDFVTNIDYWPARSADSCRLGIACDLSSFPTKIIYFAIDLDINRLQTDINMPCVVMCIMKWQPALILSLIRVNPTCTFLFLSKLY